MGWIDKLSGLYGRLEKNFKELDMFYQEIIDDHLDPKRQTTAQEDITDVLLKLQSDRSFAIDLTLDNIKAVLMNIFIAGTDTSAATLVWAMTALMKNPKVMKRVQDEIRNLIGEKGFVSEDDLQKLPYLKAIVKETLRLYPAAPLLVPRETTQTIKLEGYEIPPKTLVYVNAWAIGRDPEAWDNPEEFLPERFLGSAIDFKGQHFELVPFGAGRRGCPGIYMGAVTVELTLANLLYSFDWELPNGMKKEDLDTEVMPGITMHKKNALYLVARNYN
ncbi:cytochrome P450 71A1-like [Camellia sinensis]|uniref:cytochrome P450 71A1-like n=1 Tax=Camellia sinensis TaxID=4442 RepID=UPI0010356728|nr:cytochrome P450 71A1-like [Camellia sinensis]